MALTQPIVPGVLPIALCGPIVRRLTRTRVHVWVALSHGGDVRLSIVDAGGNDTVSDPVAPRRVGRSLWVAVLSLDGVTAGEFAAGQTYEYTITGDGWPAARSPDWTDFALQGRNRPSFLGPPAALDDLRILHTSCRRPHAHKRDALAAALAELEGAERPQLLILSGDQVYADDVATIAAARLRTIDADVVGIADDPPLPTLPPLAGRQAPSETLGLTSGEAKDHVWTLGEFYGLYLLAWSDVLWNPQPLPPLTDADPGEVDAALPVEVYDTERANLNLFLATMPAVRQVLANVSTLMIFDDHEVTDDWNLNYRWLAAVYGNAGGRRVVANGLLAYNLFQNWGNDPDRFATVGTPEQQVLAAAAYAPADGGAAPSPITPAVEALLGLPGPLAAPVPAPVPAGGFDIRDLAEGVRYDLRLGPADGYPAHLVLVDERTARHIPADDTPAGRIASAALDLQWPAPVGAEADTPTLLVAAAPVLGLHIIEHVLQPLLGLKEGGDASFDFESWTAWRPTFEQVIARINAWRRVVILSGDVHFGYAKTLTYETPPGTADPGRAVQFVASGAKHSVSLTLLLHLLGDLATKLGIIRTRSFSGYGRLTAAQRDALETVPAGTLVYDDAADLLLGRVLRAGQEEPAVLAAEVATLYGFGPADWAYTVEHLDDEQVPAAGALRDALDATPAAWNGWNRANSIATLRGLRASDLIRIGRVTVGLPQLARISFPATAPLRARQDLRIAVGEQEPGPIVTTSVEATLG